MAVELIQAVLGWSIVLNYAVLCAWAAYFILAHEHFYQLHSLFFKLSVETFDVIHYSAMAFYKIAIFLFLLAPYLALRIVF